MAQFDTLIMMNAFEVAIQGITIVTVLDLLFLSQIQPMLDFESLGTLGSVSYHRVVPEGPRGEGKTADGEQTNGRKRNNPVGHFGWLS